LYAEFENFRRRTAKEKIEMIQSAGEQLLKALLPVADDFDRAEKSFAGKTDKEAEGFFLIQNKFRKILEQNGVKPMDLSSGEFNPDIHDAITQVPVPDESQKGKVVDVVEKGYLLNDKVIRHAKVVVGA
jgi:molecular chaperone GrpE